MHHRLVKSSGARGSLPFDAVVTLSQKAVERSGEARPGHRTGINPKPSWPAWLRQQQFLLPDVDIDEQSRLAWPQACAATAVSASNHRFTGKVTIEKFEGDVRVERFDDRAIWELMYFGKARPSA